MRPALQLRCLAVLCLTLWLTPGWADSCGEHGIALQVLGSGGPEVHAKRASSSYLIWHNGKARVLIDSGGGSALRFGEAEARMADLDVVLFTHFHADHSADFPALIKSSYFENRTRPLPVYGPAGNAHFPSATAFVRAILGAESDAFRYLSGYLEAGEESYQIQAHDVMAPVMQRIAVLHDVEIHAAEVGHGIVPALAWRVQLDGKVIVFSGDTNADNGNLEKLAQGAHMLVAHNAIPEDEHGAARGLHMPPSAIGRIAAAAKVQKVVLSHRMLRTLGKEKQTQAEIAARYAGPVLFAEDLDCYAINDKVASEP